MISCVEFIAAYNELFSFLDEKYSHDEVKKFWKYLFEPNGKNIPLINFAKKNGIRGCWNYWCGTLTEEAANVVMYLNEKEGWCYSHMTHCPSKGKLLELQKTLGITPYYDYCGHCDYYRASLEKVGLTWTRNHLYVDNAECSRVLFDPKKFKGIMVMDENTEKFEMTEKKSEYFHPDFHSSMNSGVEYLGKTYGENVLREYLKRYVLNVYKPVLAEIKIDPLLAIENKIKDTYKLEKALDVLSIDNDGKKLAVKISRCPAVTHLKKTGRDVSEWFYLTTSAVMSELAEKGGLAFEMSYYDTETGACAYSFTKN